MHSGPKGGRSNARWLIGTLLMVGTAISYVDRTNISVALPYIEDDLHISSQMSGILLAAFFWTYAPGQISGGWLADRIGPRLAAGAAVVWWGLFTAANVVARGVGSLLCFRLLLGAGESVGPPTFAKVVGRWFPVTERAKAAAVYDSGSRLGTALAIPLVALLIGAFGWRASFVVTGAVGVLFGIGWFVLYRDPDDHWLANRAEVDYIRSGGSRQQDASEGPAVKVPWRDLLRHRTVWGMMIGFFGLNFAFYFFITWFPSYLAEARGLDLIKVGVYGMVPPLCAFFAEFFGGWLSDRLSQRWGVTKARKVPIVVSMVLASSIALAAVVPSAALAIVLMAFAMSCLAVAGAAIWSLPADVAPGEHQVASVAGLQNFASNLAGIVCPIYFGLFLTSDAHSYVVPLVSTGGVVVLGAAAYLFVCGPFEKLALAGGRSGEPAGAAQTRPAQIS